MSTPSLQGFLDRTQDAGSPTETFFASFTEARQKTEVAEAILQYSPVNKQRKRDERKEAPRVLRRMQGFLIEIDGDQARVAFVENGQTIQYDLPADQLRRNGIIVRNQPFQMDEIEVKLERGFAVGYRFEPLAKPSDGYAETLNFDAERKRKRDVILRAVGKTKG